MKKNLWLMAVAASILPFALNGCYTQVVSTGEGDDSEVYSQPSSDDTTGGPVTVNNYYGSDSYRDWRYQSSFRYYPHRPYWLWSIGWNDPYWYDNYDPGYNMGWDAWGEWGYNPYRHYPWSYYSGWPPYTYYSDYGYGNPYYYGRSIYGIPVYSYGGTSVPERRRSDGPTRGGDNTVRPTGGTILAAPAPSTGTAIARPNRPGDGAGEVRPEAKPKIRPSQETPWWLRTDRPRGNTGNTEAQAVPEGRRRPVGGTTSTQAEIRRDRSRPTAKSSVPTDAIPTRRPRNEGTATTPPPSRPATRERPQQNREAVSAPSREAPRSAPAPSAPQRESAPRSRKAE